MNTIKRHHDQITESLNLMAKAGFTTGMLLQLAAGRNRRGFPTQLKGLGLILSRKMTHGLTIFGLSKKGADLIGATQFDIYKVGLSRVEHALVAQFETLSALDDFGIESYEFEPQKYSRDYRPDAIWETKSGHKFYVEIELSAKSIPDGEMDRFFLKLVSRDTVVVFKDSSLRSRYIKYAKAYAQNGIPDWQLVDKKWFKTGGVIKVEKEAWNRVLVREYPCGGSITLKECIDENLS